MRSEGRAGEVTAAASDVTADADHGSICWVDPPPVSTPLINSESRAVLAIDIIIPDGARRSRGASPEQGRPHHRRPRVHRKAARGEGPAAAAGCEEAVPPGARGRPDFCREARPIRGSHAAVEGATGQVHISDPLCNVSVERAQDKYLMILQLQIFRPLKEKYQGKFSSWFWTKVCPVAGEVSLENLGIGSVELTEDLWKETDIIVHMAAAVNFRQRYDTALAVNTLGVKRIIEFASRCTKLELVLIVSTAYVMVKEEGIMLEKPLHRYKSFDGRLDLDISEETALTEAKLKELICRNASEDTVRHTMKKIGTQRARKFGWTNTYVFTKAMGEMLAYEHRSRLPLVIIRPTSTTSTWKEPFPGWIEGVKTIDTWITNYGKGHLKFLPGDVTTIIDIVPADIVVNAMLCVINCHPRESLDFIYQIGSSMRNPLEIGELVRVLSRYFSEQPFIGAKGEAVKVKELNMPATMSSCYEQMKRHYKEPLQDKVQHGLSTADDHDKYNHLEREYKFTVAVAEAYLPATFFKRRFDDSNMQKLMTMMNRIDRELISCDTKFINWEKYLMEIHIPGVMKCETREITRTRL